MCDHVCISRKLGVILSYQQACSQACAEVQIDCFISRIWSWLAASLRFDKEEGQSCLVCKVSTIHRWNSIHYHPLSSIIIHYHPLSLYLFPRIVIITGIVFIIITITIFQQSIFSAQAKEVRCVLFLETSNGYRDRLQRKEMTRQILRATQDRWCGKPHEPAPNLADMGVIKCISPYKPSRIGVFEFTHLYLSIYIYLLYIILINTMNNMYGFYKVVRLLRHVGYLDSLS
jgi:hypothetical protein